MQKEKIHIVVENTANNLKLKRNAFAEIYDFITAPNAEINVEVPVKLYTRNDKQKTRSALVLIERVLL